MRYVMIVHNDIVNGEIYVEKLVLYEETEYGIITLNRPSKRNAISQKMAQQLDEILDDIRQRPIKFLLIRSEGAGVFCAGGDLTELHGDLTEEEAYEALHIMKTVLHKILTFPVPTICLLQGNALGGGCELATACDFRLVKEDTTFGFVQSNLGILPGWGGGAILYKKVAKNFAFQWLTKGSIYGASYLYEREWIHSIIKKKDWENVDTYLQPYISKSYDQMCYLKAQFLEALDVDELYEAMDRESSRAAKLWPSEHHQQAVNAFLQR